VPAISITYERAGTAKVEEATTDQQQCLYCGKTLNLLRRLSKSRFCAVEHQKQWSLERLSRALATE